MISIIVPVYNAEKYLDRCIKSIINQTYNDLDIILINDGSKDNSFKICNEYMKKDKRIRVFNKDNSGVSDTRNYGIENANGEYIVFIDSDDYIDKDYIKVLISNFEKHSYVRVANLSGSEKKISSNITLTVDDFMKFSLLGNFHLGVCGGIFEKKLVSKFDKNTYYMEDAIFLTEYLNKCNTVKLIASLSKYHYVDNPSSITNNKRNVLNNIKAYFYSLDKINEITDLKYDKLIKNKKNVLLEKECRFINNYEEYRSLKNNDNIKSTLKKEINIKNKIIFSNYFIFKVYYSIRKITKALYHAFK